MIPIIKETRVAHNKSGESFLFPITSIFAPKMTGIDMRNENLRAVFLSNPKRRPAPSVEPDLEIPGTIDTAWAHPIIMESINVTFLDFLSL